MPKITKHPLLLTLLLPAILPLQAFSAELQEDTLRAWDRHTQEANLLMERRLGHTFLWVDEVPGQARRVRDGEIIVSPVRAVNPLPVPGGLIHHWIGASFIPGATINDITTVVRDYDRYRVVYHPTVIASRAVDLGNAEDRFSLLCLNRAVWSHSALDTDYKTAYHRVDAGRWYSVSETTRVQEIDNYGRPDERELPQDEGSGYVWRLQSIVRIQQRDGGVYVEIEVMALSRDIPAALRWMVDPIIRRVSRTAFTAFLKKTEVAARAPADSARTVQNQPHREARAAPEPAQSTFR